MYLAQCGILMEKEKFRISDDESEDWGTDNTDMRYVLYVDIC